MQGSSDCDRERDRELDFGGIINSVLVPPLLNIALPLSRATTASNATALHPRRISPASNRAAEQTLAPPPVGLEDDASRAATPAAPPSSNRPSELRAKGQGPRAGGSPRTARAAHPRHQAMEGFFRSSSLLHAGEGLRPTLPVTASPLPFRRPPGQCRASHSPPCPIQGPVATKASPDAGDIG